MCGIAGFVSPDPHAPSPNGLAEGIKHRGPDGAGQQRAEFGHGSWTLFHSRLAIVDLSEAGAQPMADEAGEWVMVFNGEIYNHQELRQRCQARGHRFRSAMDGEVILHLWEDEGERALERLNGIFALAMANTRTGEVVLARDLLGVKPLFYAHDADGSLWFASEIAALRDAGAPAGDHDLVALAQFLTFLWIPDPRSPFEGIRSLLPGHVLRWTPQGTTTHLYAEQVPASPEELAADLPEAAAALEEQLRAAVDRQLLGDVPIGLMASGGVDSSLIWSAGREGIARGYTISWPRDRGGERLDQDAAAVAQIRARLDTEITFLDGHEADGAGLPASGDLFADPAYELTRLIARRARDDGFKVLLSGQGADELFAGYRRHAIAPVLQRLRLGRAGSIAADLLGRLSVRRVELEYLARTARATSHADPFDRYMQLCSYSTAADRAQALDCTEAEVSDDVVWQRHRAVYDAQPAESSFLRKLLAVDRSVYLPGLGLAYVDRAGMEFGVEIRVPWLDLELLRWSLALPESLLIARARGKTLPRHLAAEAFGAQIAHRPKRGFAAPTPALPTARSRAQKGARQPLYFAGATNLMIEYTEQDEDHDRLARDSGRARQQSAKAQVRNFWESASCGEIYAAGDDVVAQLESQARERYRLEPYIFDFAKFSEAAGQDVLEIGVGMGADHAEWAKAGPRQLIGIDLTDRALAWTTRRLQARGLHSHLLQADAETLPFADESFDIVYSWGVLHHTPDTARAIDEVYRVLRPGGTARLMIYHRYAITGLLLWLRYGMWKGLGLTATYSRFLESPGTQAFSSGDAAHVTSRFSHAVLQTRLGVGDLLQGEAGKRHGRTYLRILRVLWPRWALERLFSWAGLLMLIEVRR